MNSLKISELKHGYQCYFIIIFYMLESKKQKKKTQKCNHPYVSSWLILGHRFWNHMFQTGRFKLKLSARHLNPVDWSRFQMQPPFKFSLVNAYNCDQTFNVDYIVNATLFRMLACKNHLLPWRCPRQMHSLFFIGFDLSSWRPLYLH